MKPTTSMNNVRIYAVEAFLAVAILVPMAGCTSEDAEVTKALMAQGFSEGIAGELSTNDLKKPEVENLGIAKSQGVDEKLLLSMVESLHEQNRAFVIGDDLRLLGGHGMTPETAAVLVDIGAIPGWSDDLRALKEAGLADDAIVDIARVKFVEKRPVIAGTSLARLKTVRMTDAGILRFVQKGGDEAKLEAVARDLALGTPEAKALSTVGL